MVYAAQSAPLYGGPVPPWWTSRADHEEDSIGQDAPVGAKSPMYLLGKLGAFSVLLLLASEALAWIILHLFTWNFASRDVLWRVSVPDSDAGWAALSSLLAPTLPRLCRRTALAAVAAAWIYGQCKSRQSSKASSKNVKGRQRVNRRYSKVNKRYSRTLMALLSLMSGGPPLA